MTKNVKKTADLLVPRQVPEGEWDDGVAEGDVPVDVGPLLARAQERLLDHVEQEEPHDAVPLLELLGDVLQLEEELVRGLGVRPPAAVHVLDQQVEGADVDAVHCRHVQPVVESVLRMIRRYIISFSPETKDHSYLHNLSDGVVSEVEIWDEVEEVVQVILLPLLRPGPRLLSLHRRLLQRRGTVFLDTQGRMEN